MWGLSWGRPRWAGLASLFVLALVAKAQSTGLTITPSVVAFPATLVGTPSLQQQTVYVYNTGTQTVNFSSVTISGANAADFSIAYDTCLPSESVSGFCYLGVAFTPSIIGTEVAQLNFVDDASGSPQTVPLSGTGQGPTLTLSTYPSALTFSPQNVSVSSNSQNVSLQNTGNTAITLGALQISGPNAGDFHLVSNSCGSTLAVNAYCSVPISFTPTAAGIRTATLTISDNAQASPQTVTLSGTGQIASVGLTANPTSLSFGSQILKTPGTVWVSLTNSGNTPIEFAPPTITGSNAADFNITSDSCSSPLAPGYSCEVVVGFTPGALGSRTASLRLSDRNAGSLVALPLSGSGISATVAVTVSPNPIVFPLVNLANVFSLPVSILNTGNTIATINSIKLSGPNAADFTLQTNSLPCSPGYQYPPAATCNFSINFTPSAAGARTATLTVVDSASSTPLKIPVSGTGVASTLPSLTFSPAALRFGNVTVGSSGSQTINIANNSAQAIPFSFPYVTGADESDFLVAADTCPTNGSINAGASCSITISFTPPMGGPRTATLLLEDGAANSPQSIFLGGNGGTQTKTLAFNSLFQLSVPSQWEQSARRQL